MGAVGARIPAEWEPTRAIWVGIDLDSPELLDLTAALATALLPHVAVKMLLSTDGREDEARRTLHKLGVEADAVEFAVHPDGSFFIRDPLIFMHDRGGHTGTVAFRWNTYGLADWWERHLHADNPDMAGRGADYARVHDGAVARSIAEQIRGEVAPLGIVIEGGAVEVNGEGVLLMSKTLAIQRNRDLTIDQIETELLRLPGMTKVIWLGEGLADDPHMKQTIVADYVGLGTGGHTDEFVRFAGPRTILLGWVEESEAALHPVSAISRDRMQRNYDILASATDAGGQPFRIIKVPMPTVVERIEILTETTQHPLGFSASSFPASEGRRAGDRVTRVAATSYLNYLVVNDHVVLPTYVEDGTPREVEDRVRAILAAVFPDRTQHMIRATAANWGGGGIHCATNSEPTEAY